MPGILIFKQILDAMLLKIEFLKDVNFFVLFLM